MINLNPSDESCIYTTLHFVCKEAHKNKCTSILTFDQPLYWKALMLIQNEPLKLGGFHTEMSFLLHWKPYVGLMTGQFPRDCACRYSSNTFDDWKSYC